jgi:hypothetical protein
VNIVPNDVLPARVNQHVAILRANEKLDPIFLKNYLRLPQTKTYIFSHNAGATREAVTKEMIENFLIPTPEINEQKQRKNFDGHYVFSTEAITMEDIDGIIKELTLCGNCHKIHSATLRGMTTSDFRELFILNESVEGEFFESELPKDISTDFWGYTPDWYETSRNYRMKKKFTCEDCGINLNQNLANGYYLETHHIDGNTKNNDEDNFKCLCVLCHASVDKYHKDNYNKGAAKQKLLDFIKLFEDELIEVGNKNLRDYKKFY